jgi:hypothetical protein
MKKLLMIFISFNVLSNVFSEQINIVEELNVYGGETIEHIYNEQEQRSTNYSKLIQYFDSNNRIVKGIVIVTEALAISSGIKEQIQYYINDKIEKYEMFFTDGYKNIYGFNRMIEEIDTNKIITKRIWYNNDVMLDVSEEVEERFQFYNIDFIGDEFFREYTPNNSGDVIDISAKYFGVRSFIKFDSRLIDLEEEDTILMQKFSTAFNLPSFEQYYSKKVKVFSENNSYWLYVQAALEQYIQGQNATIKYYPIGRNKELYLICIGFYDTK